MSPMDVQTRSAEMPVMLSSQVKTMPDPQIVVRKVRQEKRRAMLVIESAGTGTPRLLTHPNTFGAFPERARDNNIRELAKKHEFVADISDLSKNPVVRWQHKHYIQLILLCSFVIPTVIPWLLWNDARGGYVYAGVLRLCFVHHSTFCVNSLAHWLGETPFDDKHTPRDHFATALVTIGEGYHNFHHQFPMDYRNAIKWYQYDPTKWFIWACKKVGLASHLKTFPENEVRKGQLTMQLKKLKETQERLAWPNDSNDLPVISWESFQEQAQKRPLILISGFIHDVSSFIDEHPGGPHLLVKMIGKDATTAFFGGVYDHSNAAHNLLAMKRVGVLHGGMPHGLDDKVVPPSQRLKIARYTELSSPYNSSAMSDGEGLLG
ncbi:hypothetical protein NLJ89_g7193 [Agrocybe chaxingu]|uniref:stearoyl-CoA 9-desaturase n=1 Tax=Agrocybe chaxingu TaxID=84603 RepID=A0A9W8JX97_9AGAR|nr:hypothetical protein NLJ89_g7193 [Agrocybe chaxingu]